jgi:hypothetical protein
VQADSAAKTKGRQVVAQAVMSPAKRSGKVCGGPEHRTKCQVQVNTGPDVH